VSALASKAAPVLWDVRSLWADQKVKIHNSFVNRRLYNSYRRLEHIASHQSLGMSTLTNAVIPILQNRNARLPALRTVVPTAVDLDRFQLNPKMPVLFTALFSGTYNDYYDLNLSALFMQKLRSQIDLQIHWARPIESDKSVIGVGETRVFPVSQREIAHLIPNYSFGVSVCKLNAGPSLTAAMPTKIAEFLACGRPIVVNKGLGDMDRFIEEFNAGVILDGNPKNLAESSSKLIDILSDRDTPLRCRALAEKYFSMDIGANKYLRLYSQMKQIEIKNP
jgi:glycosyltransferase involved in cell wall biosynthesis